jgi:hypothetical protein
MRTAFRLCWWLSLSLVACAAGSNSASQSASPARPVRSNERATVRLGDAPQHAYEAEFFPGADHDPALARPEALLGHPLGRRPANHAQVVECWRTWAAQSPRVKLEVYGHTHEGRELLSGVVTAPENLAQLEAILARLGKLADPRSASAAEQEQIVERTPAVAWLGYSIHGDEMSGVDGGLALAHHLIASRGADVEQLLREVVVVFDPMQNPDGRERFLAMLEQMAGSTSVLDGEALSHGRWPRGRGNHYLFDMNRDWIAGVAPETRGRWRVVQRYHPQLFVDAHEMGRDDSYLFYPQADPINPHLPRKLVEWQTRYAADVAANFDRYGWSYYTREWADGWGPFYSDSWGSLNGAIGILYEQARYNGQSVRLDSGEIATYAQAAHRQAVASLSNVATLAANRRAALSEYAEQRRFDAQGGADPKRRIFVMRSTAHRSRLAWLVETLRGQGVEVRSSPKASLANAQARDGGAHESLELDGELWIVDGAQPQGALARAYLEFDTRYPRADLERERRELELRGRSKIYDVTAWNLAHALDLEAWWCEAAEFEARAGDFVAPLAGIASALPERTPVYGWLVDGADDGAPRFAAAALEAGLVLSIADEAFESAGRSFARGSLLARRHENPEDVAARVEQAARSAGVQAVATASARAPGIGHDLGGQHFELLERPRVALLSNAPVSADQFGHLWHALDRELGLPVSLLDAQELGDYDLRRYNVLVLPNSGGLDGVLESNAEALRTWVRSGGTLIAVGGAAAALCDGELELSEVRQRIDVLDKLAEQRFGIERDRAAARIAIDEQELWSGAPATVEGAEAAAEEGDDEDEHEDESAEAKSSKEDADKARSGDPDAEREERWRRRFAPQGVFLRGEVRTDLWITAGAGSEVPVFFEGPSSLWSGAEGVTTAVRLAPESSLRLSGLLWPEARTRLADSAYLTVERLGDGQVILFAAPPGFRGYHKASGRLFANAVVYGPGVGANPLRAR